MIISFNSKKLVDKCLMCEVIKGNDGFVLVGSWNTIVL